MPPMSLIEVLSGPIGRRAGLRGFSDAVDCIIALRLNPDALIKSNAILHALERNAHKWKQTRS